MKDGLIAGDLHSIDGSSEILNSVNSQGFKTVVEQRGYKWASWPLALCASLVLFAGCTINPPAPVYYRHITPDTPSMKKETGLPDGVYVVTPGDTLYSIAWRYQLDYKQLAEWNGIPAPRYAIYVGQRLMVKPPSGQAYPVAEGTPQTISIAKIEEPRLQPAVPTVVEAPRVEPVKPLVVEESQPVPAKPMEIAKPVPPSEPMPVIRSSSSSGAGWIWPTEGQVVSTFSADDSARQGIDIKGTANQPIYAVEEGRVAYQGNGLVGYGNVVILIHKDDYLSMYGYNDKLLVEEGQAVAKGDRIATMGAPRIGAAPMLHFEIRKMGKPTDPLKLLPR